MGRGCDDFEMRAPRRIDESVERNDVQRGSDSKVNLPTNRGSHCTRHTRCSDARPTANA